MNLLHVASSLTLQTVSRIRLLQVIGTDASACRSDSCKWLADFFPEQGVVSSALWIVSFSCASV